MSFMERIYQIILNLKRLCLCNEDRISSSCQIHVAEFKGISAIDYQESISCSALSQKMNLSLSRGSRIIDNLVRKGYLFREAKDQDRRITLVCLTEKGRKLKHKITNEQLAFEELLTSRLSSQEIEIVKRGLKTLEKALNQNIGD